MFSGPVAKQARFFYIYNGISLSFFLCRSRSRCEIWLGLLIKSGKAIFRPFERLLPKNGITYQSRRNVALKRKFGKNKPIG